MTESTIEILNVVLLFITVAWSWTTRLARKAGYYQGRADALRAVDLAESSEQYEQIVGHQLEQALGKRERARWDRETARW